ncbi:glutamine--fructose-6-phosphate transaminase (isomerizing) [Halalkaliarchaeum sp. AArc-GB]|uniref:glutamine--fructose-6-phosphate transaminase (isomerizing) n=1 Tax=Halalkaliarchaeum sp. AArc-GB TaxID=3074078 RepID=UPI002859835A|nr:glutamine--fructose-6-phosphate transaminase (isomerizing) [Halalkaliarchaeum sp. AArc-GB]MDR5673395.1 glutamine--fructose-6-phosphate transaminase (isomerizing) [Halalkaliarchaeum sp. AArc-GB]
MCGIIGYVGRRDALDVLVGGLNQLEYRGYDSAGVALANGADEGAGSDADGAATVDVDVVKRAGELSALEAALEERRPSGTTGIGHTRWSTHGPPTDANAHPHTDEDGRVAVVHNGIIENYDRLKDELLAEGHRFESDTDTEVVPHLIERELEAGAPPETAVRRALEQLSGSYAIAAVVAGTDAVYAARNDSPLVLGIGEDGYYLGSDVPAFLEHTARVVYLEDGEFVRLTPDSWTVTSPDGNPVEKQIDTVDWDLEDTGKSGYDHYMLKEINEQPHALRQCLSGRVDELEGRVELAELDALLQDPPEAVQFVACGTSYHAALYGARRFRDRGIPAQAFVASEYATEAPPTGDRLVIGVTQSGETADTLSALREAQSRGVETLAVTNVVGSTAARECDHAMYIRAGPEIGVAATKTFSSQLVALNLLVEAVANGSRSGDRAQSDRVRERLAALRELPGQVQQILDESNAVDVARTYLDSSGYFFIGRGYNYPVALEGALKFKEITYEHAEGFPAGELKHGTLALVTADTPVIAVVTGDDEIARKTVGNVKEVEARDAPVIAVTDGRSDVERYADEVLEIPEAHPVTMPLLANTQLQLVAYHVANELGRSIDKPRNLAKSVTVE